MLRLCLSLHALALAVFGANGASATQQCYFPNGNASPDVPCNSSAPVSSCCGQENFCLDNGLCYASGVVSRGSCTDSGWGDGCAAYCTTNNPSGGCPIQPCDPGTDTWACGLGNACGASANTFVMQDGNGFMLRSNQAAALETGQAEPFVIYPDTVLSVASNCTTAAASGTVFVTATMTVAATAVAKSCYTFSAADMAGVGLGVGVPLLIALVAAVVMIMGLRRRLNRERRSPMSPTAHPEDPVYHSFQPQQSEYKPPELRELPTYGERHELKVGRNGVVGK